MLGAFCSPVLLSHPELVPMALGLCSALLPSMGVHKCCHFCSWWAFSPFERIKNALYRACLQASAKCFCLCVFYVYDKAQSHVLYVYVEAPKTCTCAWRFSTVCSACEFKHATRQLGSPVRVYELRTEIVEAKTHAG